MANIPKFISSSLKLHLAVMFLGLMHISASQAQNLIQNGDFDSGTTNWFIAQGLAPTFEIDATTGDPSAPSLHVASSTTTADFYSSCVAVDAVQQFDFGLNLKVSGGLCQAILMTFSNTTCSLQQAVAADLSGNSNTWTQLSQQHIALPSGTQAVQVDLSLASLSNDCNFDHVVLNVSATTPVRLQLFEVK